MPISSSIRRNCKILPGLLIVLGLTCAVTLHSLEGFTLTHAEAQRIGRQIWKNESGGSIQGLTSWNAGEEFASLGIGHFIWYPPNKRGPFEESFSLLVNYIAERGAKLPRLLLEKRACPWNSRAEFQAAQTTSEMNQLRAFLADTIDLQADFLVQRLQLALPKILGEAASQREAIKQKFEEVARTAAGRYALVDYVNFKGEGILSTERYQGQGWGLLQVLEEMRRPSAGEGPVNAFAEAAARVLRRRVNNAPPARHEMRWLQGWLNRVATYRNF